MIHQAERMIDKIPPAISAGISGSVGLASMYDFLSGVSEIALLVLSLLIAIVTLKNQILKNKQLRNQLKEKDNE